MTVRGRVVLALALGWALSASEARADLKMSLQPLLGEEGSNSGWSSYVIRVQSTEKTPIKGRIVLEGEAHKNKARSETPVAVLPGATVVVRLPVRLDHFWSLRAELQDEQGKMLAAESILPRSQNNPLLFDLHSPSRVNAVLRGTAISALYSVERHRGSTSFTLGIGVAIQDPGSGDLILPQRAAEWAGVTVVLAPSDQLARLGATEQEALADYVLGGGTLAVVVKRPEDLRQGFLPLLLGGDARESGTATNLRRFAAPAPPSRELADTLLAYSGGNLRPSDLGSSAPYGMGEVHLLPFDPSQPSVIDNSWVQNRLQELVRHAWDRRAFVAAPQGMAFSSTGLNEVRGQLDPNETGSWVILAATALLLLYSVLAGPLNFLLASRAGKPLRAVLLLPLMSGVTFLAITFLAVFTKGWTGEARRLGLIEAAGGMSKGTIRRFRGFFTPVAQQVAVKASSERGLPALLSEGSSELSLHVDRTGVELRGVSVLPWKTTMVREDDTVSLQGGVSLLPAQGDVQVVNRLGRALRGVVIQVPGRGLYHLKTIQDSQSVLASTGTLITGVGLPSSSSPSLQVHPLSTKIFSSAIEEDSKGLTKAWQALHESTHDRPIDWWPEEHPVLIGQIDGGEGVTSDQGLRITQDRTLLRVVGFGGTP